MAKKKPARKKTVPLPGLSLEKAVARIQQMFDPASTVTRDEKLVDRVGNKRQYDVVIRGQFGGHPVLGIIECKDHNRKKGPEAVEAFSKKSEHLGANLRLMVSRKGFTKQALQLALHDHIGCLSLAPDDPKLAGFSIGQTCYGIIRKWINVQLNVTFEMPIPPVVGFPSMDVTHGGMPVVHWFMRELFSKMLDRTREGRIVLTLDFDRTRALKFGDTEYPVISLACVASGIYRTKSQWMSWTGDGFYDWHSRRMMLPAKGTIVGSSLCTDLTTWPDYDGEIPGLLDPLPGNAFRLIMVDESRWDESLPVPDLSGFGTLR